MCVRVVAFRCASSSSFPSLNYLIDNLIDLVVCAQQL